MSFWNDLDEMQREIENLDTRSVSKPQSSSSIRTSISSGTSQIKELEAKADKLTKKIKHRVDILTPRKGNKELLNHLGVLEKELHELNRKENNWSSKAKDIQSEVASLRDQIKKLKGKSKQIRNNPRAKDKYYQSKNNNVRFFHETPKPKRQTFSKQATTSYRYDNNQFEDNTQSRSRYLEPNNRVPENSPNRRTGSVHASMDEYNGSQINIYQFQRLQRVNQQLVRDNQNLKSDITKYTNKHLTESQHLKSRLAEKETEITNLKQQLENNEYALRDEQSLINDLQQQIVVLQQAVEEFDNLRDSDSKLQLEYQRSLQNVLQARKDKTIIEQQLNAARNQIQEMEINVRQLNHEKLGALSEMRAMKNVFEQERKNVSDRYERIVQKLESELAYAKKMYQEIKDKYRNLQHRFEHDQPQYESLKQKIDIERDQFQSKLNDVVINHCSTLDMISKQSKQAMQNFSRIQNVEKVNDTRMQMKTNQEIISDDEKGGGRKMNGIWEPNS